MFTYVVKIMHVGNKRGALLLIHFNKICRHFGLDWAFVDPKTPIRNGEKFCVCVKEFLPWLVMPLQVVYVNDNKSSGKAKASFSFGGGTLQGHLLVSGSCASSDQFNSVDMFVNLFLHLLT